MYAIVDWHVLSEGSPTVYQAEAEDFFREMSKDLAGYNNVLYEICNEPNSGADWSEIKAYAEAIIPVIRENDPDAIIIVGTPTLSQEVDKAAADPIQDYDNIMYSLHFYAATHKDSLRNTMAVAVAADAGLPIFVTEFGICESSGSGSLDRESASQWIQLLNQYGISYVAWNLSNKDETSAIISSQVSKTSGFTRSDLSEYGQWLYDLFTGNETTENSSSQQVQSQQTEEQQTQQQINTTSSSQSSSSALTNDDLTITVHQDNSWESGGMYYYQYEVTLKNTSGKSGSSWNVSLAFNASFQISDSWNGSYSVSGSTLNISSVDYNGTLESGQTLEGIGFILCSSTQLSY